MIQIGHNNIAVTIELPGGNLDLDYNYNIVAAGCNDILNSNSTFQIRIGGLTVVDRQRLCSELTAYRVARAKENTQDSETTKAVSVPVTIAYSFIPNIGVPETGAIVFKGFAVGATLSGTNPDIITTIECNSYVQNVNEFTDQAPTAALQTFSAFANYVATQLKLTLKMNAPDYKERKITPMYTKASRQGLLLILNSIFPNEVFCYINEARQLVVLQRSVYSKELGEPVLINELQGPPNFTKYGVYFQCTPQAGVRLAQPVKLNSQLLSSANATTWIVMRQEFDLSTRGDAWVVKNSCYPLGNKT